MIPIFLQLPVQMIMPQFNLPSAQQEGGPLTAFLASPSGSAPTWRCTHDTEPMRNREPFPADKVLQGYAYVLTHPGVPCVFWRHYFDWGEPQKQKLNTLIGICKQSGINSRSVVNIVAADGQKYAVIIDGKVAMKIGPGRWSPGAGWHVATDGNDFAVWLTGR